MGTAGLRHRRWNFNTLRLSVVLGGDGLRRAAPDRRFCFRKKGQPYRRTRIPCDTSRISKRPRMDRKSTHPDLERLIRQSESARSRLTIEANLLKHRLDFPERVRGSLKSHPTQWLIGSLASGLAASLLFRRKSAPAPPKPEKSRSLPLSLLALTLTAVRPLAKVWLADQVKSYVGAKFTPTLPQRTTPGRPASTNSI